MATTCIVGLPPSTYRVQSGRPSQTVVVPLGQAVTVDLAGAGCIRAGAAIVVVGSRTKDVKTPAVDDQRLAVPDRKPAERRSQLPELRGACAGRHRVTAARWAARRARSRPAPSTRTTPTRSSTGSASRTSSTTAARSGRTISSGNPFPASAVDQFNVQTQNFKAEFEQAGSAVISTVTKTGGNQFHGEIFGEWQPKAFISENYDDRPGHLNNPTAPYRPKPDFNTKYYGGDLGGPIIKDKLTFFVDFEGTNKIFGSNDVNVYPGSRWRRLPPAAQIVRADREIAIQRKLPGDVQREAVFRKADLLRDAGRHDQPQRVHPP